MKKYVGFSLVETLITIFIMAMVLLLLNVTLITMVKTSGIATGRTVSRQETEYMNEVIRRYVRNSDSDLINLYNTKGVRAIRKMVNIYYCRWWRYWCCIWLQLSDGARVT